MSTIAAPQSGQVPEPHESRITRARPVLVYILMTLLGIAAFLYPFWLPSNALPNDAHAGDAPLVAALAAVLVVVAVSLEVRRRTMTGATVAILGVLAASAGLLRLLDLPGGGNGIFFLIVLVGAAFGPRFGFLLGLMAMAVGAIVTGGIGPWLPFQMLVLAWIGAGAGYLGHLTERMSGRLEVVTLAAYAWGCGFFYGAVMNLWFWPFQQGGGSLDWHAGLSFADTLQHYWSFYVATSFGWDAAGALANAVIILLIGGAVLCSLRRFAHRLDPIVELDPPSELVP